MTIASRNLRLSLLLFLLALLAHALLAACGEAGQAPSDGSSTSQPAGEVGSVVKTDKGQYREITTDRFKAMLDNKEFFHVDVHVPNEGKLPQLDARIPYNEIAQRLDELPQDKAAKIVLTCRSGAMSSQASRQLADLGYTNIYNLSGGFNAWKAKGYPFDPEP